MHTGLQCNLKKMTQTGLQCLRVYQNLKNYSLVLVLVFNLNFPCFLSIMMKINAGRQLTVVARPLLFEMKDTLNQGGCLIDQIDFMHARFVLSYLFHFTIIGLFFISTKFCAKF